MDRDHEPEDLTSEALRFLNHEMSPDEAERYQSALRHDEARFEALTDAMAMRALLDAVSGGPPEPDPEYCRQIARRFPFYAIGGLTPPQRRDVDEHLNYCEDCQAGVAREQEKVRRQKGWNGRGIIAGVLLLAAGLTGGWLMRGAPEVVAPQEQGPPTVLSNELRLELRDVVNGARDRTQLRAAASAIVGRVPIETLLLTNLPSQGIEDLKTCVQLLGRAGASTVGAKGWVRVALVHPSTAVRREAAIWYRKVDPDWAKDEEVKHLIEAARRATPLPIPSSQAGT